MNFKNIVGKGKKLVTTFLLFLQCFFFLSKRKCNFCVSFLLSSANASNLDQSKILLFGKEVMHLCDTLCQAGYPVTVDP